MEDEPIKALRRRRFPMWRAIEAVERGRAEASISGGSTGALIATSMLCLRTLSDTQRPAMVAFAIAIKVVETMVRNQLITRMKAELSLYPRSTPAEAAAL